MDFYINWLIPGQVILVEWQEVVTMDTHRAINARLLTMLDETSASRVHVIGDTRRITDFPLNALEIRNTYTFLDHPKLDWVMTIIKNPTITFIVAIMMKIAARQHYHTATNVEYALHFLRQIDPVLAEAAGF